MADLVITAANVAPGTGAQLRTNTAGVAITAGQSIYLDTSSNAQLAKGDTAVHANAGGIAVCNAASGQPVAWVPSGYPVTLGAVLTAGATYVVSSANAGGIAPDADITTGGFKTILGVATSTSSLQLVINASGVAHG